MIFHSKNGLSEYAVDTVTSLVVSWIFLFICALKEIQVLKCIAISYHYMTFSILSCKDSDWTKILSLELSIAE